MHFVLPAFSHSSLLSRAILSVLLVGLLGRALAPDVAPAQDASDTTAQERPLLDRVRALEYDSLKRGRWGRGGDHLRMPALEMS